MFGLKKKEEKQRKVIIVGAGEVGFYVAQHLAEENNEVVVIDSNIDALHRLEEEMDVQIVHGSGASPATLLDAGAESVDIFLAVTDSDEINMMACLFAKAIAPDAMQLARIRNREYAAYPDILRTAGLDINKLVNPEVEIVHTIDRLLTLPAAIDYGEFADHRICMVSMYVDYGPLIGQPLMNFRKIVHDDGIMVAAIERNNALIIPTGKDVIKSGDLVYFVYCADSLRPLLAALNKEESMINTVCIVGGGRVGKKLAELLERKDISVKIVEKRLPRCEILASELDSTLVLHGDATNKQLLIEENIDKADAFVAVTSDEESNILSCMLVKSLGVEKTIARINKAAYFPLIEAIGVSHSVSTRLSAVNSILRYIHQGKVLMSCSVGSDGSEVLEVLLTEDSVLVGQRLSKLSIPKDTLIVATLRSNKAFIPKGNTIFDVGDHVVLLVLRNSMPAVKAWLMQER